MSARSARRAAERQVRKAAAKDARLNPQLEPSVPTEPVCDARLLANRTNAQLSTGPRTEEGKTTSSMNAVKTGLTGHTVLLPSDDVAAYQRHLFTYQCEYEPVGTRERELVQSIADAQWRLQRIPGLEMAIYARGRDQFLGQFEELAPEARGARIDLETFLQYEKQIRNLQLQEARLRRMREKDVAELRQLQQDRHTTEEPKTAEPDVVPSHSAAVSQLEHLNRMLDQANLDDPDTLASFFQLSNSVINSALEQAGTSAADSRS